MSGRILLLLLLVSSVALSVARAEEIHLKDGTKLTGVITGVAGDGFQIRTAYGEIKVPRSDVVSITFPENQPKQEIEGEQSNSLPKIDESLDGSSYTNFTNNFALSVPAGWRIAPELRTKKEVAAALMSADQTLFFLVTPETFAGTLQTYRVLVENQARTNLADFEKLSESDAPLDGRNGTRMIYRASPRDSHTPLKFLIYVIPYEGRMVRLTFFTLEPLFNDAVPVFEKIALAYHSVKMGVKGNERRLSESS